MKTFLGLCIFLGLFGSYFYFKYFGEWGFRQNMNELCLEVQNFELIKTESPEVNARFLAKLVSDKVYNFKVADMFREVVSYSGDDMNHYMKAYIKRYHPYFECPELFEINKL